MHTTECKLQIGQRVTNKKIGLPAVGEVVALTDFSFYQDWYVKCWGAMDTGHSWSEEYPNWRAGIMAAVKYPYPIHTESLEDYAAMLQGRAGRELAIEEIKYNYERSKTNVRYYPVEDLEVFE